MKSQQKEAAASWNIGELFEKIYKHSENDDELETIYYSNKFNDVFYELCRLVASENDTSAEKHKSFYKSL